MKTVLTIKPGDTFQSDGLIVRGIGGDIHAQGRGQNLPRVTIEINHPGPRQPGESATAAAHPAV